ncbi:MAG: hypothetical protein U9O94_05875 [Nanoarchaeota archaeon]|nr:hypothetical protein [Nanoarchaeota archaeon]
MGNYNEAVQAAKATLATTVNQAKQDIATQKQSVQTNRFGIDDLTDTASFGISNIADTSSFDSLGEIDTSPIKPLSPVLTTDEAGISTHENGTYSYVDTAGNIISGLGSKKLATYAKTYSDSSAQARIDKAPYTDSIADIKNRLAQGAINIGKQTLGATTGDLTLAAAVNSKNFSLSNLISNAPGISQKDINIFRAIKSKHPGELSSEEEAFSNSDTFSELEKLSAKVALNNKDYTDIQDTGQWLKDAVPVNRSEAALADKAWELTSKENSTGAAIINAVINHPTAYIRQGIDSIPFMVALSVGGPVTQIGIMTTLARGKRQEMTVAYIKEHGKQPTMKEQTAIDAWAAASMVLEKFEVMYLNKIIPATKVKWNKDIIKNLKKDIPSKLNNIVKELPIYKRAPIKAVQAVSGEAVSGGVVDVAEQYASSAGKGELDYDRIAKASLSEAAGIVTGGPGMVAANVATQIATAPIRIPLRNREVKGITKKLEQTEKSIKTKSTESDIKQKLKQADDAIFASPEDTEMEATHTKLEKELTEVEALDDLDTYKERKIELLSKLTPKEFAKYEKRNEPKTFKKPKETIKEPTVAQQTMAGYKAIEEAEAKAKANIPKTDLTKEESVSFNDTMKAATSEITTREEYIRVAAEMKTALLTKNFTPEQQASYDEAATQMNQTRKILEGAPETPVLGSISDGAEGKNILPEGDTSDAGKNLIKSAQLTAKANTVAETAYNNLPKSLKNVASDVSDGKGNWTGFNQYYRDIKQVIDSDNERSIKKARIKSILSDVDSFKQNRKDKAEALTTSSEKARESKSFWVVTGKRNREINKVEYTSTDTTIPFTQDNKRIELVDARKQYLKSQDIKEGSEQASYIQLVHPTASKKLVTAVNAEAELGKRAYEYMKQYDAHESMPLNVPDSTLDINIDVAKEVEAPVQSDEEHQTDIDKAVKTIQEHKTKDVKDTQLKDVQEKLTVPEELKNNQEYINLEKDISQLEDMLNCM